jgi:hypothetical protein
MLYSFYPLLNVLPLPTFPPGLNIIILPPQILGEEVSLMKYLDMIFHKGPPCFPRLDTLPPNTANVPLDIASQVPSIAICK